MPGTCTFIMKSGARLEFRAENVKTETQNNVLVRYVLEGLVDKNPLYIRIEDVSAVIWTPDPVVEAEPVAMPVPGDGADGGGL